MQRQALAIDGDVDRNTLRRLANEAMDNGTELHIADTAHLIGDIAGPMPVVLAITTQANRRGFDAIVLPRSPFTIVSLYPGGAA